MPFRGEGHVPLDQRDGDSSSSDLWKWLDRATCRRGVGRYLHSDDKARAPVLGIVRSHSPHKRPGCESQRRRGRDDHARHGRAGSVSRGDGPARTAVLEGRTPTTTGPAASAGPPTGVCGLLRQGLGSILDGGEGQAGEQQEHAGDQSDPRQIDMAHCFSFCGTARLTPSRSVRCVYGPPARRC